MMLPHPVQGAVPDCPHGSCCQRCRTLLRDCQAAELSLRGLRRKNANHPDLITGPFEQSIIYPPPDELIKESGKMQLLERMLKKLHAEGHKVRACFETFALADSERSTTHA